MKALHVKKGDRVKVIAGDDKGKIGDIIAVYPESGKVTVEGVNIVKRHLKDRAAQPQSNQVVKGGIIASEAPINASNVQLVVGSGKNAQVTRVGYRRDEVTKRRPDGSEYSSYRSVRVLKKEAAEKGDQK